MSYEDQPENHPDPRIRKLGEQIYEINQRELELERRSSAEASGYGRTDLDRAKYWLERAQNSEAHSAALEEMRRIDPHFRPTQGPYAEKLRKDAEESWRQSVKHFKKSLGSQR